MYVLEYFISPNWLMHHILKYEFYYHYTQNFSWCVAQLLFTTVSLIWDAVFHILYSPDTLTLFVSKRYKELQIDALLISLAWSHRIDISVSKIFSSENIFNLDRAIILHYATIHQIIFSRNIWITLHYFFHGWHKCKQLEYRSWHEL